MDGLEATEQINVEFVLVAKDYHIVMAVKRLTRAPIEEDGPDLQIVVCDTDSTAKHTLEVWNFILPLVQTEKDLLCCTPVEVEVADIVAACRGAVWWKDWKTPFNERIAGDMMLNAMQVATVELVLGASEKVK